MTLPYVPTSSRWVFVNAKNRVFAVNGADDAIILRWQRNNVVDAVGQDGPAESDDVLAARRVSSTGSINVTQGSSRPL
jgi:hypothetical protein